jgi:hypothetical protein
MNTIPVNRPSHFTIAALAILALVATGCEREVEQAATEPKAPSDPIAAEAPRAADESPSQGTTEANPVAESPSRAEAAAVPQEVQAPDPIAEDALHIKRLVITHAVQSREPLAAEALIAGSPVYAFLELANRGDASGRIVVTFEREGAKPVGHVELEVPAETTRWRTWGKTALIKEPGSWDAVIKSADGRELGRQTFEVKGA